MRTPMKRLIFPLAAAAALLAACSKQAPLPPPAKPEQPAAPAVQKPAPSPATQKRTPIPAAKPAAPSATAKPGGNADDIEPDAVNLDRLSQPLLVKKEKPATGQASDSPKQEK